MLLMDGEEIRKMKLAYYNEIDPYCCQWLRNLIAAGHIPAGDVDERDIREVSAIDLAGYGQCHFFAGIGGFAYACRLAGWPDDKPIWTGGFPCQPFSVAGKQEGTTDDRHLWPELSRLIAQARPNAFLGENVAGLVALALDGVLLDLESHGYACRSFVIPACAVDAPHRRDRVWIVANGISKGLEKREGIDDDAREKFEATERSSDVADAEGQRCGKEWTDSKRRQEWTSSRGNVEHTKSLGWREGRTENEIRERQHDSIAGASASSRRTLDDTNGESSFWSAESWQESGSRRVKSGVRLLAHGIPGRVAKLRALGNSICPQVAAEVIRAMLVTERS